MVKKRFDTWFYLAPAPDDAAPRCDGEECVDLGWFTPQGALEAHRARRDHARVPDDQDARAARAVRDRRRAARARRGRARSSPSSRASLISGETARVVLPGEPGYEDWPMPQPRNVRPAGSGPGPHRRRHRTHRGDRRAVRARARAHPRRQEDHRDGPPAVRPVVDGLAQDRVPPGRHHQPRGRRRASSRTPTSSSTSPSSSSAPATPRATSTSRARATSSRPPSTRASSASSTRRRSPPTASTRTTRSR